MNRVRILGIGSPAGEDQVGWLTVDALLANGVDAGGEVVIEKLDRPGANLIPMLENTPWVILIDAMKLDPPQSNKQVGQIHRFDQEDWPAYGGGLSSHGFGVLDTLLLARALGSMPPRLDLYGIGIASARPGDQASGEVQAAAQDLARMIAGELSATSRHA